MSIIASGAIIHLEDLREGVDLDAKEQIYARPHFDSRTFEGIHLDPEQMQLLEDLHWETYTDSRVQLVLGQFERDDDHFTAEHMQRTLRASLYLGIAMGLSRERLQKLAFGMAIHDLGKRDMREILYSPGKLTQSQRDKVNLHPNRGVDIAQNELDIDDPVILGIIGGHHEPDYGIGDTIPLEMRDAELEDIARVVDKWDAVCSQRPYKTPRVSPREALQMLRRQGHPEAVLNAFESLQYTPAHVGQVALSA